MKRNIVVKRILCILAAAKMLLSSPCAFAHPTSQEGILAKAYHATLERYCIGGEAVGWSIDELFHTNGPTITYSFITSDSYLNSTFKSYVTVGASLWSGTVTIVNKTDGSGTGQIGTYLDQDTNIEAKFTQYYSDSSGHLTSWKILMNRTASLSATILAHEFGHAIGLNDMYANKNFDKLMYAYTSGRTATSPATADQWGAKVITGVHTSHTWSFKYHSTASNGNNKHVRYCTSCSGLTDTIMECVYNANNVCRVCGVPRGSQPWSSGSEQDTM